MKKRWLAGILCLTMIISLTGCNGTVDPQMQSQNLNNAVGDAGTGEENPEGKTNDVTPGESTGTDTGDDIWGDYADRNRRAEEVLTSNQKTHPLSKFGFQLLKQTIKQDGTKENVLLSPLSVILALYMTANGADGKTKDQMIQVLGDDLNDYLKAYQIRLPHGDGYKMHIANGIWFRDDATLKVNDDFLKTNEHYFDAALYKAPFNETTCKEINNWVKEHTDGMIDSILDEISADAMLYLINALSFDAEWERIYRESSVFEGQIFTKEDGTKQKTTLMYSEESTYLEDKKATGFVKYYKDRKYAFVALLPKEGVTMAEYVEYLNAENFHKLMSKAKTTTVNAALPKFETEYDILLNDVLIKMGMTDAFLGSKADFSKMATCDDGNLYISRVLHKTFIAVDERGTKAGAVTAVEMTKDSAMMESYTVRLDRPFVYMLIDCETNQPLFIGTMTDVEK